MRVGKLQPDGLQVARNCGLAVVIGHHLERVGEQDVRHVLRIVAGGADASDCRMNRSVCGLSLCLAVHRPYSQIGHTLLWVREKKFWRNNAAIDGTETLERSNHQHHALARLEGAMLLLKPLHLIGGKRIVGELELAGQLPGV